MSAARTLTVNLIPTIISVIIFQISKSFLIFDKNNNIHISVLYIQNIAIMSEGCIDMPKHVPLQGLAGK
jgi:hypothetical protein